MTKDFWKAALIRALKTFIQTILGVWTAGQVITALDWKATLLAAVSAAIYSLLTSILAGLPEVDMIRPEELTDKDACEWLEEDGETADEIIELMEGDEVDG